MSIPATTAGPHWVALSDEATADYLAGYLIPLEVRETTEGVEAWMPHDFPTSYNVHRVCNVCHLLPLDYDALEYPCREGE